MTAPKLLHGSLAPLAALLFATPPAYAGPAAATAPIEAPRPGAPDLRSAIRVSLSLIEASAAEYRSQRQCFSCHHQALPVLTLVEARDRGFAIDEANLAAQLEHTAAHLERGHEGYAEGRGQGGQVDTAGWALWTLEAGERVPDETTAAVTGYLLSYQSDLGRWRSTTTTRPPTEGSDFTATYVALRGLETFGTEEQREAFAERHDRAVEWLLTTEPQDTEDRVFRLRSLSYVGADEAAIRAAADALLGSQRPDGGWSQTGEMESDAYATGTALVALNETGHLEADRPAYQRGVEFLLRSRLSDGSWHVPTRAKPIQTYFESGFPHGTDQFVSMAGTCWATLALLAACPEPAP